MSKLLAGLGGNAGAVAAGGVVVGVLALGAWIGSKRNAPVTETPIALVQIQPDAVASEPVEGIATPAPERDTIPDEVAAAPLPAPAFDEVRREEDGMTVVAGRAVPGAQVKLLKDGAEIATTTADGSGKFATLAMIAPDGAGHLLSLVQSVDGKDVPSTDEIILAPTVLAEVAPAAVAEATAVIQEVEPSDDAPAVSQVPSLETVAPETPEITNAPEAVIAQETSEPETDLQEDNAIITSAANEVVETEDAQPNVAVVADSNDAAITSVEKADTPVAEVKVAEAEVQTPTPAPASTTAPDTSVAVLKSTAQGVELLNLEAPEVMDNVALDTISYSDVGDVQLAGRAQADTQTVRVYLDNDAVVTLPVDAQGRWRGDVPDVDEGIYTLRVDEVGADGTVTSRVETPFKREAPETLAQAATQDGPIKAITVQSGATLWAIARDRYGDGRLYVRVFKANESSIRDPDLIYPGQIFDLPE